MAGGLFALLDDVALIARSAASSVDDVAALAGKTSVKAAPCPVPPRPARAPSSRCFLAA